MSRAIRVEAIDHLPKLVEALAEEAAKQAAEIERKATQAEELAEKIKASENEVPF